MKEAFLLINCDIGKEQQVVTNLQSLQCVREIHTTWGVFDIVVKVASSTKRELENIIRSDILEIAPVRSVLTLQETSK